MTKLTFSTAILAVIASGALAENWDLSNEYPPTSLQGQTADFFAKAVAEKTGGALTITVHHGAALGYKSVDQFDAVGDGALQAASSAFVFLSGFDPVFQIGSLPFIASDMAETRKLYDMARPAYDAVFEDAKQMLLLATPWPASGLWGNKAFNSAEDLKEVKIRTYDVGSTETFRNAGAFPVQIAWSDVPAQLSTHAISAVLTSANGGAGAQFWELQSHFTDVNYTAGLQGIHVNRDAFEALSPEEQAAIQDAAAEAEAFGWQLAVDSLQADYEKLRSNNVTVTESISLEFAAFLKEAGRPFAEKWLESAGDELKAIYDSYVAETAN